MTCRSEQRNDPSSEKHLLKVQKTIADLADRYLKEHAEIHKKKLSIEGDKVLLRKYIIPTLGRIKINSLTSKDVVDLHYDLRDTPIAANRCIALLSKMLSLAEKWSLRSDASSLCKHIDKYPENKKERFLSIEEIDKLSSVLKEASWAKIEHPSVTNAIKLLLLTGCRLSEILTLKWEYIDKLHHRINLPDSKTGKKSVYISPFVLEIFENIERKQDNPYVIYGTVEGKHLINLQKAWRRIRKRAGLDDVRIHDLRHSFASIGAASGLSLPIIGALLGHTQTQTTARYAHLIGEPLKDATSLIGEKMKSMLG